MEDQNASLGSFSFRLCASNFFPYTMATLPVKAQELGLKKAAELRKGAVEGVVLVGDGLDSPRLSNCEVSM